MSRESHDRTFQSREIIWNTFESMSRELDVPIDELVNEAMEAYARVRGYAIASRPPPPPHSPPHPHSPPQGRASFESSPDPTPRRGTPVNPRPIADRDPLEETYDAPALSPLDRSYSPARAPADFDDDDLAKTASRTPFVRPGRGGPPPRGMPAALGRMPGSHPGNPPPAPPPVPPPMPSSSSTTSKMIEPYSARPPIPGGGPPLPSRQFGPNTIPMPGAPLREAPVRDTSATRRLVLTYQGRPYTVDKDRYLIGRSKTQADLRLDDPNVSRQHAVIEHVGSAWYIVDLGSTNGVLVAGERVARRALSDGDVIIITSHEIRCSVR